MPRWKYLLFALAAVVLSVVVVTVSLAVVDVYLHRRFTAMVGLNVWGYRGPVVSPKAPGTRRVVVLGGSTAFGYGVFSHQSMPAFLDRALKEPAARERVGAVDVVNLGYNNEGAYAFRANLEDYRYLKYDLAVFYTGYNDLGRPNTTVFRRTSPIFRLTGYMPILPIILQEKAMVLRYNGDLDAAYRGRPTAFRPNIIQETGAGALDAAAAIARSLERQLGRLSSQTGESARVEHGQGCGSRWEHYCGWIAVATDYVLSQGKSVMVVGQPYIADLHVEQQAALEQMLRQRFGSDPRVRAVNLGHLTDLRDPTLALDGMHLSAVGNRRVADALVPTVLEMLR